ncbi:MAG TPA: lysylphosphatidylglycerol synthase domain-containing protein, partial [Polyangiaceae bacterium]|nr:lysylphosphatidylglycerol synthase domain-containing protein [Polyangiaceae bacterium]
WWSTRNLGALDREQLTALLEGLDGAVLWLFVPFLLGLVLETWGWQQAIGECAPRPRFGPLWSVRFTTEAIGQTLPGGALLGESLKPALLARLAGMPLGLGVAATLHRKYLRLLAHGLYVGAAAALGAAALLAQPGGALWLGALVAMSLVLWALALGSAAFFRRGRLAVRLFAWARRLPWAVGRAFARKHRGRFLQVDGATREFFRLDASRTAWPVLLCGAAWLSEAVESWLVLRLLGVEVPFGLIIAGDVVVQLMRQLAVFVPAGLGVQDAGYLALLSFSGVPDAVTIGVAFVLLKRLRELTTSVLGLGWGAAATALDAESTKRSTKERSPGARCAEAPFWLPWGSWARIREPGGRGPR